MTTRPVHHLTAAVLLVLLASLLSCCHGTRPTPADALPGEPVKLGLSPADSATPPQQVVRRRLFGVLPAKAKPGLPALSSQVAGNHLRDFPTTPRKCKGCTFILNPTAPVTVAGKKATVAAGTGAAVVQAGKKSTAVAADSGATVYTVNATRGQAAAGHDISQQQVKPGFPWGKVLVGVGAAALVGWLAFGGGGVLLLGWLRRKKETDNQA